jgi:hypothetical protein
VNNFLGAHQLTRHKWLFTKSGVPIWTSAKPTSPYCKVHNSLQRGQTEDSILSNQITNSDRYPAPGIWMFKASAVFLGCIYVSMPSLCGKLHVGNYQSQPPPRPRYGEAKNPNYQDSKLSVTSYRIPLTVIDSSIWGQ